MTSKCCLRGAVGQKFSRKICQKRILCTTQLFLKEKNPNHKYGFFEQKVNKKQPWQPLEIFARAWEI